MRRLLLLTFLVCGCGDSLGEAKKEQVPLDQVPFKVMKSAHEKLPDIKFNSAFKKSKGVYQVRGKAANGQIRQVEVNEAGEVTAVE